MTAERPKRPSQDPCLKSLSHLVFHRGISQYDSIQDKTPINVEVTGWKCAAIGSNKKKETKNKTANETCKYSGMFSGPRTIGGRRTKHEAKTTVASQLGMYREKASTGQSEYAVKKNHPKYKPIIKVRTQVGHFLRLTLNEPLHHGYIDPRPTLTRASYASHTLDSTTPPAVPAFPARGQLWHTELLRCGSRNPPGSELLNLRPQITSTGDFYRRAGAGCTCSPPKLKTARRQAN
jgi:hypothetical protein